MVDERAVAGTIESVKVCLQCSCCRDMVWYHLVLTDGLMGAQVHFLRYSSGYDEWLPADSVRR